MHRRCIRPINKYNFIKILNIEKTKLTFPMVVVVVVVEDDEVESMVVVV
jgi:hypothetical protein